MITLYVSPECHVCDGFEPKVRAVADRFGIPLTVIQVSFDDIRAQRVVLREGWTFGVPTAAYKEQIYVGVNFPERLERDLQAERDGTASLGVKQAEARSSDTPYTQAELMQGA